MSNYLEFWKGGLPNPMREVSQLQRAMDRLFDDWAGTRMKGELATTGFNPTCEVSETKNAYQLKFDLPGVPKEQIKIEFHDNLLTVAGERKEEKKEEDRKRHYTEMFYGSFMRSFAFPTPVDAEKIEAKYDHGVLTVNVQKTEQTRTRQVTIR